MKEQTLDEAAIALDELMLAYMRAGFTREEALHIALTFATANIDKGLSDRESPKP